MAEIFHRRESRARKQYPCFWCGEQIESGERYASWRYSEGSDHETIQVHPECSNAWNEAARCELGGIYETMPYDHSRGCRCQHGFCECEPNGVTDG